MIKFVIKKVNSVKNVAKGPKDERPTHYCATSEWKYIYPVYGLKYLRIVVKQTTRTNTKGQPIKAAQFKLYGFFQVGLVCVRKLLM